MEFIREFIRFIINRKKYWLVPILIAMAMLGYLAVFTKGSAMAPFLYSIF